MVLTYDEMTARRFNHTRAHDRLDRWPSGAEVVPAPDGRVSQLRHRSPAK